MHVLKNKFSIITISQLVGRYIFKNRLFIQIVPDHFGHITIYGFIIGYAVTHCVYYGYITFSIGPVYTRYT